MTDRTAWEAALAADGFNGPLDRRLEPGKTVPEHTHPFDARLFILDGEFILTTGGQARSYGPGETLEVPAGVLHAESVGPTGATYLAGRRPA